MNKFDIYEMVTNLIVDRLEAGVVPWQMPWKSNAGMPRNLVTKKPYRGFNFWYLLSFGFERPYFLTFNQVKELGGTVKKGAKSFQIVFWKMLDHLDADQKLKKVPMLRYYRVFHIDQVEGIPENKLPDCSDHDHEFDPIAACDRLVENWTNVPVIETGKCHACYYPFADKVEMPSPRNFFQDEHYYSVLFHELVHSTGHRKRLDRHSRFPDHKFGSRDYSQEELVAEMGAAYLCGLCGIENSTIDNSAAYIQSWLKVLKSDNKFILQAASYAQRAVNYILEHQKDAVPHVEHEPELVSFSF